MALFYFCGQEPTKIPAWEQCTIYDVVLDCWPKGRQGEALSNLVVTGDIVARFLPYGFVGLIFPKRR